jgi:alcohol dehydrogenase (NADP+)
LVDWYTENNIHVIGYSPLGRMGKVFATNSKDTVPTIDNTEAIKTIAAKHKKTPAQIALKWNLSRSPNISVIPKTTNFDRFFLKKSLSIFVELDWQKI